MSLPERMREQARRLGKLGRIGMRESAKVAVYAKTMEVLTEAAIEIEKLSMDEGAEFQRGVQAGYAQAQLLMRQALGLKG